MPLALLPRSESPWPKTPSRRSAKSTSGPAKASNETGSVEQHLLRDQIEADRDLATVEFYGCDGAFYSKPLIGNVDIRDHFNGGFTNLINGTTTVEVFGNGQVRMDKVRFDLPAAFLDEKLELIRIVDTGAEAVQRVWLAGLTVEAVESDCPADFSGDGVVSGEDLAILLGGWGPGCAGDLDGDGIVSGADLAVMLGAWGACNP